MCKLSCVNAFSENCSVYTDDFLRFFTLQSNMNNISSLFFFFLSITWNYSCVPCSKWKAEYDSLSNCKDYVKIYSRLYANCLHVKDEYNVYYDDTNAYEWIEIHRDDVCTGKFDRAQGTFHNYQKVLLLVNRKIWPFHIINVIP